MNCATEQLSYVMVTHFAICATLQNNGVPAVEHLGCV